MITPDQFQNALFYYKVVCLFVGYTAGFFFCSIVESYRQILKERNKK